MRSISKTVEQVQVGDFTLRLKADGSLSIAQTRKSAPRLSVTDMGKTKDGTSFVLVAPQV